MRFIFIILLIRIQSVLCQDEFRNDTSQAMSYTQKAILAYPSVKSKVRDLEKKLINYIPIEKEYVITSGSIGLAVIRGRIETKPIKKMDIDFLGGRARPDVFYNFRGKDKGAYFNITWGF